MAELFARWVVTKTRPSFSSSKLFLSLPPRHLTRTSPDTAIIPAVIFKCPPSNLTKEGRRKLRREASITLPPPSLPRPPPPPPPLPLPLLHRLLLPPSPLPHLLFPHHLGHVRPRDRLPERRGGNEQIQKLEGVGVRHEFHKLGPSEVVEVLQVIQKTRVLEEAVLGEVGEVLRVREELKELEVLFFVGVKGILLSMGIWLREGE